MPHGSAPAAGGSSAQQQATRTAFLCRGCYSALGTTPAASAVEPTAQGKPAPAVVVSLPTVRPPAYFHVSPGTREIVVRHKLIV